VTCADDADFHVSFFIELLEILFTLKTDLLDHWFAVIERWCFNAPTP
jgi:hypothetical protein